MVLKIEKIEKLNQERTQGKWEKDTIDTRDGILIQTQDLSSFIITGHKGFGGFNHNRNADKDACFIATTPTITEQYIKARRFEVTEEFVDRVDNLISDFKYERPEVICRAVLEAMWEEIENG